MKQLQLQRGLSLIELMVGLLLSALLLLGVLQIFDGNRRTYTLQESFSRVQESGRIATDMLAKELRNAAFDGCGGQGTLVNHYSGQFDFSANGISGKNNVANSEIIGGKLVVPGTDILIVSGAVDACGGKARVLASDAADKNISFQGNCPLSISPGKPLHNLIMLANCRSADITSITAANNAIITTAHAFNANTYGAEARMYRPFIHTFFIHKNGEDTGLYMSENGFGAQELVPGIDDLQLSFGRDTGITGVVDVWEAPSASLNEKIAAVRMQLVVAATDASDAERFEYIRLHETEVTKSVEDGRLRTGYRVLTKLRNRGVR